MMLEADQDASQYQPNPFKKHINIFTVTHALLLHTCVTSKVDQDTSQSQFIIQANSF